jgi:hypothetical protein
LQNIGRPLTLNRDSSTKVARIIVPVFPEPGEDPTDMVASFRPLVAVLQGLRRHDEQLVEQLTSRALSSGKRKVHVPRDENGQIIGADGEGTGEDQEQDDTDAAAEAALLHFSSPRAASTIAALREGRTVRPTETDDRPTRRSRRGTRPHGGGNGTGRHARTMLRHGLGGGSSDRAVLGSSPVSAQAMTLPML